LCKSLVCASERLWDPVSSVELRFQPFYPVVAQSIKAVSGMLPDAGSNPRHGPCGFVHLMHHVIVICVCNSSLATATGMCVYVFVLLNMTESVRLMILTQIV
jgi:hypothetical protein